MSKQKTKITILGSGSFVSSPKRYGPSFLLEIGNTKILVDTGSGCQIRLNELGILIKDIDYIFLTHFHPDHSCDLASIYVRQSMCAIKEPELDNKNTIFGPKGINNFIETVLKVSELGDFIDLPGPAVKEIKDYSNNNFSVKAYATEHISSSTLAYRFKIDDKIIVFSGDTTLCPGIINACQNADLVFIDSSKNEGENTEAHLSTTQVATVCNEANVKKVVLCHILGYNQDRNMVSEVKKTYDGEAVLSEDLMTFSY